jgi:preprotein translocase subunit SecD
MAKAKTVLNSFRQRFEAAWKKLSQALFSDWKPIAVSVAFLLSLTTLIHVATQAKLDSWLELVSVPVTDVKIKVRQKAQALKDWNKMNKYEQDEIVKDMLDQVQLANNMQILGKLKRYVFYTNLKLGLDLKGGSQLLLKAEPAPPLVPVITKPVMDGVETVINNRINSLGVAETVVQRSGQDRLIVELPGIKDPQQAKDRIGTTALLEFKELVYDANGKFSWKSVDLTGAEFKHAQAQPLVGGVWKVNFEFKPEGAKKFAALTTRLVGKAIGIFLDGQPTDREPDGAPVPISQYRGVMVREPILAGTGEITGNFNKDQAVDLAVKLNAGALPVPVKIIEERTVGATLGQDSIQKSLIAGLVGIALVMLFMVVVYGLPGLVADIALILYTLATLAIFSAIPVTLTLAGIAGFILSIGMAVDANILIFERTKEELRNGRTLYMAIENGFGRAFSSIFDSNVNSLIACTVLMLFGTSIVKGFAVTLAIGVAVSMFTAITATRTLLHLIPRQLNIFGQQFQAKAATLKSKEIV